MGTVRRLVPDVLWILLAVLSGGVYGAWASGLGWIEGSLVGLAWGLVLAFLRTLRRRKPTPTPR